ncbi:uncharacterized protein TrAtP1_001899 [Trichoderma atroviride]|uniref:Large ribosomal subunit protein mL45 n=1 Tax=Hypocrea atroviridis (strain ATCC 20476 / IMI 206040) TaxID=452589 RepID=G9P3J2_HYPAI|nr:uncharacterized protein TRIATDRAFT_149530 [Trichoderma atroviride IMI 206040]EHK42950.1 hypothetical protein TRIATDRAFT_149530 [Trichoderma atroviride IMI 206040]UKZ60628.1 hypothetical protein TrAtP1_001899 [Trichoderma atroviride]
MSRAPSLRPIAAAVLPYGTTKNSLRCVAKPLAAQIFRQYATQPSRSKTMREMDRAARAGSSKMTKEQSISQLQKMANAEYFKDGGGPLFPGTFVSLPLSRLPLNPADFAQYQWNRLRHWTIETVSLLNFKLKSMPNWTTRPQWKARRGKIAPTAKALYQEVLEAFAAGDKATLERICVNDFAKKLMAAIDRRNPRERVHFEVTKYNSSLFYPKRRAHQIHQINVYDKNLMTEQAVVAISSTQQVSRYDASTGETIPGSVRIQDKVEYVVLSRQVSAVTFKPDSWRVWGTTAPTTLEAFLEEKDAIDKEQARRAGWKPASK